MTAVTLVCPTGQARFVPVLDIDVAHGETVDVPDEIAGRPPRAPSGTPGEDGYDPGDLGEGLLAQTTVWQPAGPAKTDKPKAAAKAATTEGSDQ